MYVQLIDNEITITNITHCYILFTTVYLYTFTKEFNCKCIFFFLLFIVINNKKTI